MTIKIYIILSLLLLGLVFLYAGCAPQGGIMGSPAYEDTGITGIVSIPSAGCFVEASITRNSIQQKTALSHATVILQGNNGHEILSETDADGRFEITGLRDSTYLLFANQGDLWLAAGIPVLQSNTMKDIGEVNPYTSMQVFLFQNINMLYPGSISPSDIPMIEPPHNMLEKGFELYNTCRDPWSNEVFMRQTRLFIRNLAMGTPHSAGNPNVLGRRGYFIVVPENPPLPSAMLPSLLDARAYYIERDGADIKSWDVKIDLDIKNPYNIPLAVTSVVSRVYTILVSQDVYMDIMASVHLGGVFDDWSDTVHIDWSSHLNFAIGTQVNYWGFGSWSQGGNSTSGAWHEAGWDEKDLTGTMGTYFTIKDGIFFEDSYKYEFLSSLATSVSIDTGSGTGVVDIESEIKTIIETFIEGRVETSFNVQLESGGKILNIWQGPVWPGT